MARHSAKKVLAAVLVTAIVGVGSLALHHVHVDVHDDVAHDCLSCRVAGTSALPCGHSSVSIVPAAIGEAPLPVASDQPREVFLASTGSRGPPATV